MLFDDHRLYRLSEIIGDRKRGIRGRIPVSRTTWFEGLRTGRYPEGVRLSERVVAWRGSDLNRLGGKPRVPPPGAEG